MLFGARKPRKSAVFISGGGSTLQALLENHFQFCVTLVVSNRRSAVGLLKARRFGCETLYFSKDITFSELTTQLKRRGIERLFLAGFMKLLPAEFVASWDGQIFNIHPSALPAFPGLNSFEKSFESNSGMGVTIHQVNQNMDEGRIFLQQKLNSESLTFGFSFSQMQLRRTEQHLLREFAIRRLG